MQLLMLEDRKTPATGVDGGYVIVLGLGSKEIYLLCLTDSLPDVIAFQESFCRKTGFKLKSQPVSVAHHNHIVEAWHGVQA